MTYHSSEEFADAIEAAAQYYGMQPVFIEKDYWVTYALKNLSCSEQLMSTVFKGGTSLSKVYKCIHRFSEDVDLAIITDPEASQMQIKRQMKAVEIAAAEGLALLEDSPPVKRGKNRFSCYGYPSVLEGGHLITSPFVRLEISAFTQPVPYEKADVQSYLGSYLWDNGFGETVSAFGLGPFKVLTLWMERTFSEKLLSLIRLSFRGEGALRGKIRHFHDLALLLREKRIKEWLKAKDYGILDAAYQDDRRNTTFQGEWMEVPFVEAPLFSNFQGIWEKIKDTYHSELTALSWAEEIPEEREIYRTMEEIRTYLDGYAASK